MVAPCAGGVLRAAVVDREPLPCVCGAWGCALARAGKIPPHRPAHPKLRAVADRFAPDPGSSPHEKSAEHRGKIRAKSANKLNGSLKNIQKHGWTEGRFLAV